MGCYGIGVGRLAASVCEAHRRLRPDLADFDRAVACADLLLRADNPEVAETSRKIYDELMKRGVEVLWDDRPVSAGVMFSDADLFGVPVRVVVSPKGLKNGTIEISARDKSMSEKMKSPRRSTSCTITSFPSWRSSTASCKKRMRPGISPGAFCSKGEER